MLTLLKHGEDVDAQSKHQETSLHVAVGVANAPGASKIVDSLLSCGADETTLNEEGESAADVGRINLDEAVDSRAEGADFNRQGMPRSSTCASCWW